MRLQAAGSAEWERTLVNRDKVCRRQWRVLARQGHIRLLFPFLPVDLDRVYWRRDLVRVDGGAESFVWRACAVGWLGDVGSSVVGVHEA